MISILLTKHESLRIEHTVARESVPELRFPDLQTGSRAAAATTGLLPDRIIARQTEPWSQLRLK